MKKKKLNLEYMLNATPGSIIWSMIATPSGLARWFADEVDLQDDIYSFKWGDVESREARLQEQQQGYFLRLHWTDDEEEDTYFELRIEQDELTRDCILKITDFAESDEVDDLRDIWDSQVNTLARMIGA